MRVKRLVKLRRCLTLIPIAILCLGNQECQSEPRPKWTAKFWTGSANYKGIVSSRRELVTCDQPMIEDFVCVTYDDLKKLETEVLNRCERWKQ